MDETTIKSSSSKKEKKAATAAAAEASSTSKSKTAASAAKETTNEKEEVEEEQSSSKSKSSKKSGKTTEQVTALSTGKVIDNHNQPQPTSTVLSLMTYPLTHTFPPPLCFCDVMCILGGHRRRQASCRRRGLRCQSKEGGQIVIVIVIVEGSGGSQGDQLQHTIQPFSLHILSHQPSLSYSP